MRVDDENNIVNVCKDLYDVVGVSIRKSEGRLVEKVINGGTKVRAKDRGG